MRHLTVIIWFSSRSGSTFRDNYYGLRILDKAKSLNLRCKKILMITIFRHSLIICFHSQQNYYKKKFWET
jgi:hypothetical protein